MCLMERCLHTRTVGALKWGPLLMQSLAKHLLLGSTLALVDLYSVPRANHFAILP